MAPEPWKMGQSAPAPRLGEIAAAVIDLALQEPELSPRELATALVDQRQYFVSEASVYRLLKAQGLLRAQRSSCSKPLTALRNRPTAVNQLWQTDFTYLRIIGGGGLSVDRA